MVYALKISQNEIVHSLQTSQKEMTYAQKEIAHNQKEIAHNQKEIAYAQKEIERTQKEMASSLRWAYLDIGLILVFGISALAVLGFALQH
jgi:peptidoglycan hydrolase CwlO-like protein